MMLLALPKREKRGRKKDERTKKKLYRLQMACLVKSELTGQAFSKTWESHMSRARPKKPDLEVWRCAGILQDMVEIEQKEAVYAVKTFDLSMDDLKKIWRCE